MLLFSLWLGLLSELLPLVLVRHDLAAQSSDLTFHFTLSQAFFSLDTRGFLFRFCPVCFPSHQFEVSFGLFDRPLFARSFFERFVSPCSPNLPGNRFSASPRSFTQPNGFLIPHHPVCNFVLLLWGIFSFPFFLSHPLCALWYPHSPGAPKLTTREGYRLGFF